MKTLKTISKVFNIITIPFLAIMALCFVTSFIASLFTLLPQFKEFIIAEIESGRATSDFSPEQTVMIIRGVLIGTGCMMLLAAGLSLVAMIFDIIQVNKMTLGGAITNLVFALFITNPLNLIASVFQIIVIAKEKKLAKKTEVLFESQEQ